MKQFFAVMLVTALMSIAPQGCDVALPFTGGSSYDEPVNEMVAGDQQIVYQSGSIGDYSDGDVVSVIIGGDGTIISGTLPSDAVVPQFTTPQATTPAETPVNPGTATPLPPEYAGLEGVWQCFLDDPSHPGGMGCTWAFGANGYAMMERGEGEYSSDGKFFNNNSDEILFGTYTISGGTLTFTVTEDWCYNHGNNIGDVYTYSFSLNGSTCSLDGRQYHAVEDIWAYMSKVRSVQNGSTTYDLTGKDIPVYDPAA